MVHETDRDHARSTWSFQGLAWFRRCVCVDQAAKREESKKKRKVFRLGVRQGQSQTMSSYMSPALMKAFLNSEVTNPSVKLRVAVGRTSDPWKFLVDTMVNPQLPFSQLLEICRGVIQRHSDSNDHLPFWMFGTPQNIVLVGRGEEKKVLFPHERVYDIKPHLRRMDSPIIYFDMSADPPPMFVHSLEQFTCPELDWERCVHVLQKLSKF